jgi:hypothetical protein
MNKIKLERVHSGGDCTHVKLLINGNDVGILYLKTNEVEVLIECLKKGIYSSETDLETDIFDEEEDFDLDTDS